MQISDILLLLSDIILFIPWLLLSLLYLIKERKQEGAERKATLIGFVTFTLLTIIYAMWTISDYANILLGWPTPSFGGPVYAITTVVLLGAALILLACWTLAISRPNWLHERKLILAVAGFILWVIFLGSFIYGIIIANQSLFLVIRTVFLTIVFIFALAFVLLKATTENTAFILFAGLLIYSIGFIIPGIPLVYPIEIQHVTPFSVWLILIWYIITNRQESKQNG